MIRHLCAVLFAIAALCILAAINLATDGYRDLAAFSALVALGAIGAAVLFALITPGSSDE